MSVPYLPEAAAQDDLGKLVRFVRLHLGDGNEAVGKEEIDRSWAEAVKILLRDETGGPRIHRRGSGDERIDSGPPFLPSAFLFNPQVPEVDS
jgi:hypothetical protein